MGRVIDRRKNGTQNANANRHKYLKRIRRQIKEAIPHIVEKENLKDLTSGKKDIEVPIKGTKQPSFHHNHKTGNKEWVHPGNDKWSRGDTIPKPMEGQRGDGDGDGDGDGNGRRGSKGGGGEDDFVVTISREEFMEYFFQDLELPDMIKQFFQKIKRPEWRRAGLSPDGIMPRLNLSRSMRNSVGRRIAVKRGLEERIKELEEELKQCQNNTRCDEIKQQLDTLKERLENIPFLDDIDLRFNRVTKVELPVTRAVMFCIMDVSASMGFHEKDLAKRFFTLLYLFLNREYEDVELVFIRHTHEADEVDEDTFFNDRKTGGTAVKPAIELAKDIMEKRYSNHWNVYMVQASDGDSWGEEDSDGAAEVLNSMRHMLQAAFYIEISNEWRDAYGDSSLWESYQILDWVYKNKIRELSDIWPVFQEMFKKQEVYTQ